MSERTERILRALANLADMFEQAAVELRLVIGEIVEVGEVEHLNYKGKPYARVAKSED